ncbi:MAG: hypothetical protein CVV27_01400 [Candidatus Melainabacteria bacterium HGW-Melainabacteria-1]|nr:MAG: hypothetical protein CVV27_01400 [Candidatus Melainabacteria bacterium HGW-Melainabacteria-1]
MQTMTRVAGLILAAAVISGCTANLAGLIGANPSASPSPGASSGVNLDANVGVSLPDPLEIASAVGLSASSCSEESKLKSSNGPATRVSFKNSSQGSINIYWLNQSGQRVSYKKGLATGATHQQSTFVTHPWVITNDQDQCLGIYTPTDTQNVSLDIKKTVTVSGGSSVSGGDASATAIESRITCLNAKGDTATAAAVKVSLNLYLQAMKAGGVAQIAAQAYLKQAQDLSAKGGC